MWNKALRCSTIILVCLISDTAFHWHLVGLYFLIMLPLNTFAQRRAGD